MTIRCSVDHVANRDFQIDIRMCTPPFSLVRLRYIRMHDHNLSNRDRIINSCCISEQ